jgi:uncharacterized protein (DUF58 family)
MGGLFVLFIIVLFLLAAFTREDFILVLLYFMAGIYAINAWWSLQSLKKIRALRKFSTRVFWGEKTTVTLTIYNSGFLPIPWLQAREALPIMLHPGGNTHEVLSLSGKNQHSFLYSLDCRHRGCFPLGPLDLFTGDLLGVTHTRKRSIPPDYLLVFPKIIPLSQPPIPSLSPLGTLRYKQPIFEDPSRARGKRDYISSDSLRSVDWKATAIIRRLQVKMYEPSIALSVMIFLNLNLVEYDIKFHSEMTELAIVAAASLTNWVVQARQSVGLATNGQDTLLNDTDSHVLLPSRGRSQLLRILDMMARLHAVNSEPIVGLIQRESVHLGWGTTIIVITNLPNETLFDGLLQARRRGLQPVLVLCGPVPELSAVQQKSRNLKLPIYHLMNEQDIDIWRQ